MWRVPGAALLDVCVYSLSKRTAASTATAALPGGATLLLNAQSRAGALPDGVDFWNTARMQRSHARDENGGPSPREQCRPSLRERGGSPGGGSKAAARGKVLAQ
jgi:hypothetical protein